MTEKLEIIGLIRKNQALGCRSRANAVFERRLPPR
jgi:hypothetical protein